MTDRILISDLRLFAFHGLLPAEAVLGQRFRFDLARELDLGEAGRNGRHPRLGALRPCDREGRGRRHRAALQADRGAGRGDRGGAFRAFPAHRRGGDHRHQAGRRRCNRRPAPSPSRSSGGGRVSEAFLGLGSNLGDREALLRAAVAGLAAIDGVTLTAASPIYETAPWGPVANRPYLNACIALETELPPRTLLWHSPRDRAPAWSRARHPFRPRTLDIDLLAYDALKVDAADLDAAASAARSSAPSCWCRSP